MTKNSLPIIEENDVSIVRQEASDFAQAMGFDNLACAQVALGVSEIAQNVLRYASQGMALIFSKTKDRVLCIEISDQGQGFKDIEQARIEGFSTTASSLGLGISVAERAFDQVLIESGNGQGSKVILEKYLPLPKEIISYGSVCVKDERYLVNGDAVFTKEFDGDKILLAVIDGIGQGQTAFEMSNFILKLLQENFRLPLDQLLILCDTQLKESPFEGGAAIALALIDSNHLKYIGIGDTHSYLYQEEIITLSNLDGRLGEYQLPPLILQEIPLSLATNIILCSDGINTHVAEQLPDRYTPPQFLANYIFNTYHRLYGDATVLVAQYQPDEL